MDEEENKLWMFDLRLQNVLRGRGIESIEDLREFIVSGCKEYGFDPLTRIYGIGRVSIHQIIHALAEWEPIQTDDAKALDNLNRITMEELNRVGVHVRAAQEIIKKHERKKLSVYSDTLENEKAPPEGRA